MEITVKFEENSCSFDARFYDSAILEPVNVTPNGREIVVKPNERIDGFSQVTVEGDKNLKPENIVSGVTIYGVTGTREDEGAILTPITVVPTGTDFTEYPRFDGFSEVTVAGDINLEPQNIAAGVVIYGVEGTLVPGATSSIPEEYLPFVDHALLLYTGEYENMAILEWNEHLAIVFMMSDFAVTEHNEITTEFKAQGWVSCSFNKLNDNWNFTDWRDQPSTGGNYVMNIRYSSTPWMFNGAVIWPFGAGGGESGGGGGAGLNIAYGDTAPDDTTKLWVKAAEPNAVKVTTNMMLDRNSLEELGRLPTNRYGMACAAVGSKVYLFGGRVPGYNNAILVFDIKTKTVETLSITLPNNLAFHSAAAFGNKIYIFGGLKASSSYSNAIHLFNAETNAIETLDVTLPVANANMACAVVGTKVYLFGGSGSSYSNRIIEFDSATNTVTQLDTTLPNTYGYITAVAVGTSVYLFGGRQSNAYNTIHVFDTETKMLSTLNTTLPTATYQMAGALIGSKIYLFGGYGVNTINAFDIASQTIETLETTMPNNPTYAAGFATIDNVAYLFGGQSGEYSSRILAFSASASLGSGALTLLYSTGGTNIPIISSDALTVEMNVVSAYIGDENGAAQPAEAFIYKDGAWTAI